MKKILKRYYLFIVLLAINLILAFLFPDFGKTSFSSAGENLLQLIKVVPPIFVLLGLLDVWVDRSTMIRLMGKDSKATGALLALVMGSFAAGPLYAAFPIAIVMIKKRASVFNVMIFIGAWSTTKIPMEIFEIASLGYKFALIRLALSIVGIFIIAFILEKSLTEEDKEKVYKVADASI